MKAGAPSQTHIPPDNADLLASNKSTHSKTSQNVFLLRSSFLAPFDISFTLLCALFVEKFSSTHTRRLKNILVLVRLIFLPFYFYFFHFLLYLLLDFLNIHLFHLLPFPISLTFFSLFFSLLTFLNCLVFLFHLSCI